MRTIKNKLAKFHVNSCKVSVPISDTGTFSSIRVQIARGIGRDIYVKFSRSRVDVQGFALSHHGENDEWDIPAWETLDAHIDAGRAPYGHCYGAEMDTRIMLDDLDSAETHIEILRIIRRAGSLSHGCELMVFLDGVRACGVPIEYEYEGTPPGTRLSDLSDTAKRPLGRYLASPEGLRRKAQMLERQAQRLAERARQESESAQQALAS